MPAARKKQKAGSAEPAPQGDKQPWLSSRAGKVLLVVLLVGAAVVFYIFRPPSRSFPAVADGSYVGRISGLNSNREEQRTLFIERVPNTVSLLMVVFSQNFKPQAVVLNRQYAEADDDELTQELPYEPVTFEYDGRTFSLSGRRSRSGLSGDVFLEQEKVGEWSLSRVSLADVELRNFTPNPSFNGWLSFKAEHRLLSDEVQRTKDLLSDRRTKLDKLQKFIREEELLRARAAERKTALQDEVRKVTEERKRAVDNVTTLADEVGAYDRISKEGRAVDVARRIAEREAKWYLANWRGSEDQGGMEEFVSERVDVDLEKLDAAVARAQEIRRFEREILDERKKIAELERRIRGGAAPETPEAPGAEGSQEEKRSLWDRLFN